jgi:hypothetical protein
MKVVRHPLISFGVEVFSCSIDERRQLPTFSYGIDEQHSHVPLLFMRGVSRLLFPLLYEQHSHVPLLLTNYVSHPLIPLLLMRDVSHPLVPLLLISDVSHPLILCY